MTAYVSNVTSYRYVLFLIFVMSYSYKLRFEKSNWLPLQLLKKVTITCNEVTHSTVNVEYLKKALTQMPKNIKIDMIVKIIICAVFLTGAMIIHSQTCQGSKSHLLLFEQP